MLYISIYLLFFIYSIGYFVFVGFIICVILVNIFVDTCGEEI